MAVGQFLVVFMVAVALAAMVLSVDGGRGRLSGSVLTLERIFPPTQVVEMEVLKARDRVRHSRMLQNFAGGIVDFEVDGTSDPYLVG